jgi:hypothetical protein
MTLCISIRENLSFEKAYEIPLAVERWLEAPT